MKRWLIVTMLAVAALVLVGAATGDPGDHGKGKAKAKGHTLTANGGRFEVDVVTTDQGCSSRVWATDTLHRVFKVKKNEDGSYTVRREDRGTFVTTGPQSPSADPCPGVIRRGKHGTLLRAGATGKIRGYIVGTVTGGTFNPNGTCATPCGNVAFIAGFFSAGSRFTCNEGYAGCRFNFTYTAQRQNTQQLKYHHWVDRGLNGVDEIFIGDIATS